MGLTKKCKIRKCRTCFDATKGFQSLKKMVTDEKQPPKSYGEILKELTNINVMDDIYKDLTQFICGGCCRKLKAAYGFVQQAQEVNEKLLTILNKGDNGKQIDCLQELQVDIETCLEIKLEDDAEGVVREKVPTSELELKEEEPEEFILAKNLNVDTLNTDKDEEPVEMITLNVSNDLNSKNHVNDKSDSDEDIFNIDTTKPDTDISDNDDNAEDNNSNDSDWEEQIKSSPKKVDKKKINSKSDKKEAENDEEDIAVPCNQCNKIFKNSKALALHQSTSHIPEDQKCACPLCGHKFTRTCNMYKHMRTFHGPDSVPLIRKPSTQERTYQCNKCSRNYVKKKHLNVHMRNKHSNENENEKDKDKEKSDEQSADGKKPKRYEQRSLCSVCGSSFTSKTFLIIHMRRHTGERPFKCDLCDRAYPRIHDLTVHKRLHTGEKPFVCKLCGKAFRVSNKLTTHMRSHTDIRPYKCTQCERSFKYSKDLNVHFRIHTGERPYCCNVCGSTFTQSNSLKAHRMKLGHIENSVQNNTVEQIQRNTQSHESEQMN